MQWVFLALAFVLVLSFVIAYNGLVKLSNMCKEAWSGIDVQLKKRSDLIPNLVDAVQGYSHHEKSLFKEVAEQRALAMSAQESRSRVQAENAISQGLKGLIALAEAYPELKAATNFLALQKELIQVEDQIQLARRYFNGAIRMYNNRVESFPSNLVAKITGYQRGEYFALSLSTEREVPEITWRES